MAMKAVSRIGPRATGLAGAFFDQFDERDFLQLKRLWASEIQKRGDHL